MFDYIQKAVAGHKRINLYEKGLTPAAVLVPLFVKDGELCLLLSRRTDRVLKHKRQVSFPGGVRDPQDSDMVATALREAHEEVGLVPDDVEVLGFLSDITTLTNYVVTPVVGTIPFPYGFKLNPAEVDELIHVPWTVFSNPQDHRCEYTEHRGRTFEIDYYAYGKHVIWGATARIARQLVELVEGFKTAAREQT